MAKGPRIGTGQGLSARKTESVARGRILAASTLLLACACAKQLPPPGGPEDRTAPSIISSNPASGAVGIAIDSTVSITFSEPMQKDEVERALNIFPAPPNPPRLYWHDNSLFIAPDTAWDSGRTYIVTLQGNARDRRNNRLAQSLQVAFSTGDRMDSGTIHGQIVRDGRPARNALALCYTLHAADPNPELDTADYVVQTDTSGGFTFGFLADATYRVFGLEDKDNDWLWTIGDEAVAVPAGDVSFGIVRSTSIPPMTLTVLDTASPAVVRCQALPKRSVRIDFDKALDSAAINRDSLDIQFEPARFKPALIYALDSHSSSIYVDVSSDLTSGSYRVMVRQTASRIDTCDFTVPDVWERVFPGTVRIVPDTRIPLLSNASEIEIVLSEPVVGGLDDSILLVAEGDTVRVWPRMRSLFKLVVEVPESHRLRGPLDVIIPRLSVLGVDGLQWPTDSAFAFRLLVPHADSVGEVDLRAGPLPSSEVLRYTLILRSQSGSVRTGLGDVSIRLSPGDYGMEIWGDRDGNGHRDLGWPYPFRPSEPVWRYTDTLQVRARFTTELTLPPIGKK